MSRIMVIGALVFTVSAFAGNPADGLQFMLDFRSSETNITGTSVGNTLNFSGTGAALASLSGGSTATNKVHQVPVKCVTPVFPWQTNDVYALRLPQRTRYDEVDGVSVKKVNPVAINFSNSAIKSERQTTYVRFRWGGPIDDTASVVAWMILNGYNWNATGADGTVGVGWGVGIKYINNIGRVCVMATQTSKDLSWDGCIEIEKDVWYDMFIAFEPDPTDTTKSKVTLSVLKPTASSSVDGETVYRMPTMQTMVLGASVGLKKHTYSDNYSLLRLGAESPSANYEPTTYNGSAFSKAFRGDIARLMTWSRVLDEDEKWQVMSGCWGSTLRLGFENGSADEFSGDTSGNNVWSPADSWAVVRRSLTSTNPSLTIRDVVPDQEIGVGKILHVKPVATNGAMPVEVFVNGESIGTYDLSFSASRAIFISGDKWMNGEDGCVQIRIERKSPYEMPLEIDSVTLGGGWCMDGGMTREGYVKSHHFIGSRDPLTVQRATIIQTSGSYPCVSFSAWIADDALSMIRHSFAIKVRGGNAADIPHAFWVNGHKFAEFASSANGVVLSADVPPSVLKAGENVFSVSNCVPLDSSVKWVRYSSYQIDVRRAYGLSVVLR